MYPNSKLALIVFYLEAQSDRKDLWRKGSFLMLHTARRALTRHRPRDFHHLEPLDCTALHAEKLLNRAQHCWQDNAQEGAGGGTPGPQA